MIPVAAGRSIAAAATILLFAACAEKAPEAAKKTAPPTLITTTQAQSVAFEVVETTLGTLESVMDPKIAAEVAGRVVRVEGRSGKAARQGELLAEIAPDEPQLQQAADRAEVRRLSAVLEQQERLLARQRDLQARNFISRNAVDEAQTQRESAAEQLAAARARLGLADRSVGKTRVLAPYDGSIVVQIVAPGDYVKVGDPLFQFVSNARIRANLPFPEHLAGRVRPGQTVRLSLPQSAGHRIESTIADVRPTLLAGSRAIEAIVRFDNPGNLIGGGSVDAEVVVDRRDQAVVVPEQSVVLRPAGKVVYAIVDGKAEQRPVETGGKRNGVVEIVSGLAAGTTVAVDGAGFLAHGAAVAVRPPPAAGSEKGRPAR